MILRQSNESYPIFTKAIKSLSFAHHICVLIPAPSDFKTKLLT